MDQETEDDESSAGPQDYRQRDATLSVYLSSLANVGEQGAPLEMGTARTRTRAQVCNSLALLSKSLVKFVISASDTTLRPVLRKLVDQS